MPDQKEFRKNKRKQGAQPGNLNAFKHGFYSKLFEPLDREDIENLRKILIDPNNDTVLEIYLDIINKINVSDDEAAFASEYIEHRADRPVFVFASRVLTSDQKACLISGDKGFFTPVA